MLGSAMFPGKTESPVSAPAPAKGENSQKHIPQWAKSGWKKFTESIKQGRAVPACSDAQRSTNQCK
jgi:hypothetical protein